MTLIRLSIGSSSIGATRLTPRRQQEFKQLIKGPELDSSEDVICEV